jgi:hypothetical protein
VGTVIMHNVVSVDGFIAGEHDNVGSLHDWYFSGDTPVTGDGDQPYDHSGTGRRRRSISSTEWRRRSAGPGSSPGTGPSW